MSTRGGIIVALVSIVLLSLMTLGQYLASHEKVTIENDLGFRASIDHCASRSISGTDPMSIRSGTTKRVSAGKTCLVFGPTTDFGPANIFEHPGKYIGCLVIPPKDQRINNTVALSSVDRTIGLGACDDIR